MNLKICSFVHDMQLPFWISTLTVLSIFFTSFRIFLMQEGAAAIP